MHYGFGGFGMILFWVALIAVVVLLVKMFTNPVGKSESGSNNSLRLLKERYATGKITKDEFEEMKHDLLKE